MATLIQAQTANEAWLKALNLLLTSADSAVVQSRNGMTTEILHVTISIEDPRQRWVFARQPAISPAFALAEAVWIVSGRNDSAVLNFLNQDLRKYAGDGPTFYGAYGHRIRRQHGIDQLEMACRALKANAGSRQVVLQIWDSVADLPNEDGKPRSQDIPCNTQSILRVQNGKLHWLQTMRSNDIFRGLPYNIVQFTTLQEVMASWLGLELGRYSHVVSCFHCYHSDLPALKGSVVGGAVSNPESFLFEKETSVTGFSFLNDLISGIPDGIEQVMRFIERLDAGNYPVEFKNAGNVILSDAARRHKRMDIALDRLNKVTNPCLQKLANSFLARFRPSGDLEQE